MMCNNPKLVPVNINANIKFGENMSRSSQDIERKQTFGIKGHNSGTNFRKITCNNPKLDLVNMNANIKFGENMSSSSQDSERKRNFGKHQGP